MCGIYGVIQSESQARKVTALCDYMLQSTTVGVLRGDDSTGMFQVGKNGAVNVFKRPYNGGLFADLAETRAMCNNADSRPITIGHHRAATRGAVNQDNCHPFEHYDDERYVVGVHNGYFSTWYEEEDDFVFHVDSDWGLYRIYRDGWEEALKELDGAYALVWYENSDGLLRVACNGAREFHFAYVEGSNAMVIASEAGQLNWLCARNGIDIDPDIGIVYPKNHTVYAFNPEDVRNYKCTEYTIRKPVYVSNYKPPSFGEGLEEAAAEARRKQAEERMKEEEEAARKSLQSPDGEPILWNPRDIETQLCVRGGDIAEFYPRKGANINPSSSMIVGEILLDRKDEFTVLPAIMDCPHAMTRANVLEESDKRVVRVRIIGTTRVKSAAGILVPAAVVSPPVKILSTPVDDDVVEEIESLFDCRVIPGPDGLPMTSEEFSKFTVCDYCTGVVTPKDAIDGKLFWGKGSTGTTFVLHTECAEELGGGAGYVAQGE